MSTDPLPAWLPLTPIAIEVGRRHAGALKELEAQCSALRESLFLELGIRFARASVREGGEPLGDLGFRVLLDEVQFATGAAETPARIVGKLAEVLRRHARRFVTVQAVEQMLEAVAASHPALVGSVVPHVVSLLTLTEVLGRFAEEELPLRNLPAILQAIAEVSRPGADGLKLSEGVRGLMKHEITARYAQRPNHLVVFLLDPEIEKAIASAIKTGPDGVHLALEPELAQEICSAVRAQHKEWEGRARPVLLTTAEIRRFARKLFEFEFEPPLKVMSYQELTHDVNLEPIGRVSMPEQTQA